MSTAVATPGADIPKGDLGGLCKAVWRRVGWEHRHIHDDREWVWPALHARLVRVRNGVGEHGGVAGSLAAHDQLVADFERDLRDLLALPVDRFRRCVDANATNARGVNALAQAVLDGAQSAQVVQRPREQPGELLARFGARGVLVQAIDGNLHVQPAEALSEADRAVLVSNKLALLEVLTRPAVIF